MFLLVVGGVLLLLSVVESVRMRRRLVATELEDEPIAASLPGSSLIVYTTLSAILGLLGGYLAIQAQEVRLKIILGAFAGAFAVAALLGIVRLFSARPFTKR